MKRRTNYNLENKDEHNPLDSFGYEEYCELADRGFKDKLIAQELNVSENFFSKLKEDAKEKFVGD